MKKLKSQIHDAVRLLKCLNVPRLINLSVLQATYLSARYLRVFRTARGPAAISIEPTTACNLRCPECPSGLRSFTRPTGKLNIESYKCWLHQHSKTVIWINLYFQGEPFLHSDFFKLVRLAKKKRYYTMTSTNGHFLTEENCRHIIRSGLDRLVISLDGLDQDTYEKYRRGGNLQLVLDGIENLTSVKREMGVRHPFIEIQFLVLRNNEHQIDKIKSWIRKPGIDEVALKSAQFYDLSDKNNLIPITDNLNRYHKNSDGSYRIKGYRGNHCRKLWISSVITWNGMVVPCCYDKDATYLMGRLDHDLFPAIWKGERYQNFRKRVFTNRKSVSICTNCAEGIRIKRG